MVRELVLVLDELVFLALFALNQEKGIQNLACGIQVGVEAGDKSKDKHDTASVTSEVTQKRAKGVARYKEVILRPVRKHDL